MKVSKGKYDGSGLERRVHPRFEPDPESDLESDGGPIEDETGFPAHGSSSESDSQDGVEADEEGKDKDGPGIDASQLSFGALARAQATIGNTKDVHKAEWPAESSADDRSSKRPSAQSKRDLPRRSSKHAPTEATSKRPVSRKRDFISVSAREARDPRFLPLRSVARTDEERLRARYAFVEVYREDEMRRVREAAGRTRDPADREALQQALVTMESRQKAQARRDKERDLIREHRRAEKDKVKQGKTPFYLKKSDQRKKLLMEQFAGMNKKQVDQAIVRARKKSAAKEKRALPFARRSVQTEE